ncbi:MAG: hypothetical protein JWQ29_2548 [Phenylobacterium sp.]|nr:hypothetical protein [Phenylobacterium sp.]
MRAKVRATKGFLMSVGILRSLAAAFAVAMAVASSPVSAASYLLTDLGDLPGGSDRSVANAINDAGQIAGESNIAGAGRGFRWSNGTMEQLGTFATDPTATNRGQAINASGQIAGTGVISGHIVGVLWTGATPQAISLSSQALGVNDAGTVVGIGSGPFIFQGGSYAGLPNATGGCCLSQAYAINNSGVVVGAGTTSSGDRALVWSGGALSLLANAPGALYSNATAINDAGLIAGQTYTSGGVFASTWLGASVTLLADLAGGGVNSQAFGINETGAVVGFSQGAFGQRATLWNGGNVVDLNTLIDPSDWVLSEAKDINNKGQIVGQAYNRVTGVQHGFLLTPISVPEPSSWALMIGGFGLTGAVLRRRQRGVLAA